MDFNKFLGDSAKKAAKEQLQQKAIDVAGEKPSGHVCVKTTGSHVLKA